jgi:hypothetical protein
LSVYKPAKSPFYAYDFQINQVRFTGSTGSASKRDAETIEKQRKIEARVEVVALAAQENAPLNFATAAARYYLQVGQHLRGDGPSNCQWSINWLENEIGSNTRLASIDDALVAKLVGIRRGEGVKPATVNRSATEPLRKILNRARDTWGQKVVKIDWNNHMLSEPNERVEKCHTRKKKRCLRSFEPTISPSCGSRCSPVAGYVKPSPARSFRASGGLTSIGQAERSRCLARDASWAPFQFRPASAKCFFRCKIIIQNSSSPMLPKRPATDA